MAVIYDSPADLGAGFAVRLWTITSQGALPGRIAGANLSELDRARELIPSGMVNLGRTPDDDPRIVEVWL